MVKKQCSERQNIPKATAPTTSQPGKDKTINDVKTSTSKTLENSILAASVQQKTVLAQRKSTTTWEKSGSTEINMDNDSNNPGLHNVESPSPTTQWNDENNMMTDASSKMPDSSRAEDHGEWQLVRNMKKAKTQVTATTEATPLITAKEKLKQRGEELLDTEY